MKWINGSFEAVLAIPLLGGALVISLSWTPLLVMLILHIIALVFSVQDNKKKAGPILGIVTSCVAWIPGVGFVMHVITAIFNMVEAAKDETVSKEI